MTNNTEYPHRLLARLIIEAKTPLAVGSGERNVMTDRLVATDVNGLPFIPGTALAGVLRNALRNKNNQNGMNDLFGYQNGDNGKGSRLILSSAQMVGKHGEVIDGLKAIDYTDDFYSNFQNLPIRQHVRITHRGAADEQGGKFDEQVVYKGTRFCFELKLVGNTNDEELWNQLLDEFSNPAFRIGGGTRKGFGAILVKEVKSEKLDLTKEEELNRYLDKTSELNDGFWKNVQFFQSSKFFQSENWIKYELELTPDDFFLFGSGFGNEDGSADISYVTEKFINWKNNQGEFSEEKVLIPATSVKGALAHRTAFYFNKTKKVFADKIDEPDFCSVLIQKGYWIPDNCKNFDSRKKEDVFKMITEDNPAVRFLFGYSTNDEDGRRGNVLFSDIHLKQPAKQKLLNHVAIDRFTGGAMDGALFSEEVTANQQEFTLSILVNKTDKVTDEHLIAFECALNDLCNGMLPLGGGTMRGHGCFSGNLLKNGEAYEPNFK